VILHGALRPSAWSLIRLATEREYRRVSALSLRYLLHPRRRASSISIDGKLTRFPDAASFLSAYEEIFVNQIYAFTTSNPRPRIVDLGANVGVSVLYFKQRFPAARIEAYEPDPSIFGYLKQNVESHGLTDVMLHNAAVWTERRTLRFEPDGADGGRIDPGAARGIEVPAVPIAELLGGDRIDFLKMDIEGAEDEVLPACEGRLGNVDNLFVEYHSSPRKPQRLDRIIDTLAHAGFRISMETIHFPRSPFLRKRSADPFDLQVNISGYRD
jgi:FkbM family methyltransferase